MASPVVILDFGNMPVCTFYLMPNTGSVLSTTDKGAEAAKADSVRFTS